MATALRPFSQLSDPHLLETVRRLADEERHATAALIRSLMELDARRLYLGEGFPSLFVYCTQVLHLSEHAAYNRIEVSRTGRRHPRVLDALEEGAITLTAARLLGAHLTDENCVSVLAAARHRNKRGVEELIASLRPLPDVPTLVRRLPAPTAAPAPGAATVMNDPSLETRQADSVPAPRPCSPIVQTPPRPAIMPLAPQRYRDPVHRQPVDARQAAPRAGLAPARRS